MINNRNSSNINNYFQNDLDRSEAKVFETADNNL